MARILVVDDDPDVLKLVSRVLTASDHTVFTANNAIKAMDLLNATMFDLVISDARMPHFSGFELVSAIRNNKKFQGMAVAMLTGLRERKDIEKALRAGVDEYIVKPIDPLLLTQKIETLFEKKPPMQKAELILPESSKLSNVKAAIDVKVLSISELGLCLKTSFEIPEGTSLTLSPEIFQKMQVPPPPMKVISCRKHLEYNYEIRVGFMGVAEPFYKKIRAWVHAQNFGEKKKVS